MKRGPTTPEQPAIVAGLERKRKTSNAEAGHILTADDGQEDNPDPTSRKQQKTLGTGPAPPPDVERHGVPFIDFVEDVEQASSNAIPLLM